MNSADFEKFVIDHLQQLKLVATYTEKDVRLAEENLHLQFPEDLRIVLKMVGVHYLTRIDGLFEANGIVDCTQRYWMERHMDKCIMCISERGDAGVLSIDTRGGMVYLSDAHYDDPQFFDPISDSDATVFPSYADYFCHKVKSALY